MSSRKVLVRLTKMQKNFMDVVGKVFSPLSFTIILGLDRRREQNDRRRPQNGDYQYSCSQKKQHLSVGI